MSPKALACGTKLSVFVRANVPLLIGALALAACDNDVASDGNDAGARSGGGGTDAGAGKEQVASAGRDSGASGDGGVSSGDATTSPPTITLPPCAPSGKGTDYQVGTAVGQLASLDDVPWETLSAGDTVRNEQAFS